MKILYYSPHPQLRMNAPTGYGTHMREMIAAWQRMGIEVKTLIGGDLEESTETASTESPQGRFSSVKAMIPGLIWESVRDTSLQKFDREMGRRLEEMIGIFQPDFVYERVAYLQNSGVRTAQEMGVKHIAEINAPYPDERISFSGNSLLLGKARRVEKEILTYSHGISVVSSALKNYLIKILPEAASKISVIPNAVNPAQSQPNPSRLKILREKYKLRNKLVVGFVGSMFPYHGVDILIQAFAKMTDIRNVHLLIVGDGAILDELKRMAKDLGIGEKVTFTGSVNHSDVYDHIELMDITVMPKSNWYGSPVKIFEYALLNKPVIAPDVLPVRDVMSEKEGILVKPDIGAFSKALVDLIGHPEKRIELGMNWNAKVLEKYTWDAAARSTLKLCT